MEEIGLTSTRGHGTRNQETRDSRQAFPLPRLVLKIGRKLKISMHSLVYSVNNPNMRHVWVSVYGGTRNRPKRPQQTQAHVKA